MRYGRLLRPLIGMCLRNPSLLLPMLTTAWHFRARGWAMRFPFLPLPPRDYLAWRMQTAYGSEDAVPPAREFARYLRWTQRIRRA